MARSSSRVPLFIGWILAGALLCAGGALTAWNLRLLRVRSDLHALLRAQRVDITLGMELARLGKTPAEIEQIVNAYEHPEQIDIHDISWNLRSRPTPFVGSAAEPGQQKEGWINAQQMRDENDVSMPKPAGVFRVFLTGGSFAYGVGVPDPALNIAALLEGELNRGYDTAERRVEVFNAAHPAWSSTHERTWIENKLALMEPDLVVMLTGANDCHWGYEGCDVLDVRLYNDKEYFALINIARRIDGLDPYPDMPPAVAAGPVPAESVAERFAYNVRLAAGALAQKKIPLLVATQPFLGPKTKTPTPVEQGWLDDAVNGPKAVYMEAAYDAMEAGLREVPAGELRWASLRGVFSGRSDPIFIDMLHTVDKGNRVVAEALAKAIADAGLAPRRP